MSTATRLLILAASGVITSTLFAAVAALIGAQA